MTTAPVVGTPEKRGNNRWFVPSGSAGVGYTVGRMSDGRWRCTYPSFRWRQTGADKHIAVVRGEVMMT